MADEEVIVPTSGNPALDPTAEGVSGIVARAVGNKLSDTRADKTFETRVGYSGGKHWSELAEESYKNSRRLLGEGDIQKEKLKEYWEKRKRDIESGERKTRPKVIFGSGMGGGGGSSRVKRTGQFGISNATSKDYGVMRFKSKVMQEAASATYTCIFPLNSYLPQVCGPFRPFGVETIGGMPQSLMQEASQNGGPVNMDEV